MGNRTDKVMQSQFADDVIVYAESRDKLGSGSEFREDKGGIVRRVEEGVKDREMLRVKLLRGPVFNNSVLRPRKRAVILALNTRRLVFLTYS